MTDQSNLPAQLADLGDLEEGRNRAIELWLHTYDTYHANAALAASASIGGKIALSFGGDRYDREKDISEAFGRFGECKRWEGHNQVSYQAREDFERLITHAVDRRCWHGLLERLGFDQLLDRQAREEFQDSLKDEPPAFTRDNCTATFGHIWGNRRDIYLRGIANVFMAMDRRFRSHDAFEIGNRLIIENAKSEYGASWNNYNRRDTMRDVERIFRELDGLGPLDYDEGIAGDIERAWRAQPLPCVVEGDYFRVRCFGNGNLHLWFTRKDLLKQVNELLLEYYKPIEGDVSEDGPSYESGPLFHKTPAKHYGEFFSSEAVAAAVLRHCDRNLDGLRVLEPSAGSGMLAKAAKAEGALVTCVELQAGLAHELSRAGFNTFEADFLQLRPADLGQQFDVILMNPPFDRGRDCDHVRHAWEFLKPGGVLVAVMSARAEHATDARHKALHDLVKLCWPRSTSWAWRDLPERSFAHAGTNVNTVTLKLEKPRA